AQSRPPSRSHAMRPSGPRRKSLRLVSPCELVASTSLYEKLSVRHQNEGWPGLADCAGRGRACRSAADRVLSSRLCRMPEAPVGVLLVAFAAGEAHQLTLHAPGGEEIDPGLAGIGPGGANRRLAHDTHAMRLEMRQRGLKIVNIEGEVMAAHIAVH